MRIAWRAGILIGLLGALVVHAEDKTKLRLALNWVPEPEFGGIYAAREGGAFAKHQLDVEILGGGAGAPVVQLVATGRADFGVASADEVISARSHGVDVIAIFATYQTCPQGIMVHASRGLKTIADVFQSGTLAMETGLPYSTYLKNKYGFEKMRIVPYQGGVGRFLKDPNFSQQCFVTSEPILAKKQGSDPQTFLIAEAGYNPYTAVIITHGNTVKNKRAIVGAMKESLRQGWQQYLDDPKPTNELMGRLNKSMDAETFASAAQAQRPLIETDETKRDGLGAMSLDRWKTLAQQLADLKVVDKAPAAEECFVGPGQAGK